MIYRYLKISELEKGYPCLFQKASSIPVPNYKNVFGNNCVEFASSEDNYLPERLILKNGEVVIPTEFELYQIDGANYQLNNNNYFKRNVQGTIVDVLQKPSHNFIHGIWDEEEEMWIESATEIEIINKTVSDNSELITQKERTLYFDIRKGKIKGLDVSLLEEKKSDIMFEREELQKQMQASSDYVNGIITEEEYLSISSYVTSLIMGIPQERPIVMNKYDTQPPVSVEETPQPV